MKLLTGEFDIHIINACNLSCTNCSVLDFKFGADQEGKNVNTFMKYEDVVKQVELIKKWGYKLEVLKILGGEPTTTAAAVSRHGAKCRARNPATWASNDIAKGTPPPDQHRTQPQSPWPATYSTELLWGVYQNRGRRTQRRVS